jgi:predicted nucleotidyltransferase
MRATVGAPRRANDPLRHLAPHSTPPARLWHHRHRHGHRDPDPRPRGARRARGVLHLDLFGSMARGEAGPKSDIDLVAEIDRSIRFSLIDHVGLKQDLADLLGRPVEISTAPWEMRPRMRARFEANAIEVF